MVIPFPFIHTNPTVLIFAFHARHVITTSVLKIIKNVKFWNLEKMRKILRKDVVTFWTGALHFGQSWVYLSIHFTDWASSAESNIILLLRKKIRIQNFPRDFRQRTDDKKSPRKIGRTLLWHICQTTICTVHTRLANVHLFHIQNTTKVRNDTWPWLLRKN